MKNAVFATLLLICFAGVSIAADPASVAGTYISQRDNKQFITLYPDSTFHIKQRKKPADLDNPFIEISGKYILDGETLKLMLDDGGTASGQLKANTFEDTQGDKWVKPGTEEQNMERPKRHRNYIY
jgi:hypothetical protein